MAAHVAGTGSIPVSTLGSAIGDVRWIPESTLGNVGEYPDPPNGGMTGHRLGCRRVPEPCREIAGPAGGHDAGESARIHGGTTSKVRSGSPASSSSPARE